MTVKKQYIQWLEDRAANYRLFIPGWPALWQDIAREAAALRAKAIKDWENGHGVQAPRRNLQTLPAPRKRRSADAHPRPAGLVLVEQVADSGLQRAKETRA